MQLRLAERLPQALLEAGLIVFAVLVALGVDEYWEGREERRLAETAIERIASEIRANRSDLLNGRPNNRTLMADLGSAVTSIASGDGPGLTGVNYEVSLLGADAWHTAEMTRAVHFMDFDRVGRISMVYRIQQLYLDRQAPIVDDISQLGGADLGEAFGALRRGLAITLELQCDLLREYDTLLEELEPGGTLEPLPEDCG